MQILMIVLLVALPYGTAIICGAITEAWEMVMHANSLFWRWTELGRASATIAFFIPRCLARECHECGRC